MRRLALIAIAAALSACATPSGPPPIVQTVALTPADAATGLSPGALTARWTTTPVVEDGMDPVVTLELVTADGRTIQFQEANHTNQDLEVQAAGGPLAQAMGFFGEESATLYRRVPVDSHGVPFICGPDGPLAIGYHAAEGGGEVRIVGLKSEFEFQTHANGATTPVPYSPDQICARMRFTPSAAGN